MGADMFRGIGKFSDDRSDECENGVQLIEQPCLLYFEKIVM